MRAKRFFIHHSCFGSLFLIRILNKKLCAICGETQSEVTPQVDAYLQGASLLLETTVHRFEVERLVTLVEGVVIQSATCPFPLLKLRRPSSVP